MSEHYIEKCKECGKVISRCRCMSCEKTIIIKELCNECINKKEELKQLRSKVPEFLKENKQELEKRKPSDYFGQNHNRYCLEGISEFFFIKLWPKEYVRSIYFLKAFESGFFNFITNKKIHIEPLFKDENDKKDKHCCGYLMSKCIECEINEEKENYFISILLENAKKYNYFYYDLYKSNIMKFNNEYCLVDLDSVYPLDEFDYWCNSEHIICKNKKVDGTEKSKNEMIKNKQYRLELEKIKNEKITLDK